MNARMIAEVVCLSFVVIFCWLGVLGMWRMREPIQALHFVSFPATGGVGALTLAVLLWGGMDQAFWKTLLIGFILFSFNSVVAHATARSFRTRELGHWEPREGDPLEFVRDTEKSEDGR